MGKRWWQLIAHEVAPPSRKCIGPVVGVSRGKLSVDDGGGQWPSSISPPECRGDNRLFTVPADVVHAWSHMTAIHPAACRGAPPECVTQPQALMHDSVERSSNGIRISTQVC